MFLRNFNALSAIKSEEFHWADQPLGLPVIRLTAGALNRYRNSFHSHGSSRIQGILCGYRQTAAEDGLSALSAGALLF
jgi:hypothetical protein